MAGKRRTSGIRRLVQRGYLASVGALSSTCNKKAAASPFGQLREPLL